VLIFSGASVKTVQIALGHSTPVVTLNTYVGLWPEQIDRTRTLVDAALAAAPTEGAVVMCARLCRWQRQSAPCWSACQRAA
jgi:hypothetical protein